MIPRNNLVLVLVHIRLEPYKMYLLPKIASSAVLHMHSAIQCYKRPVMLHNIPMVLELVADQLAVDLLVVVYIEVEPYMMNPHPRIEN